MRRTEARQGVRILGGVGPVRGSELSQLEAAELPGIGERTFRRWYPRYEERVTRAYCIAGSARRRASGFPWIGARRRRPHSDALSRLHGAPLPPTSGARSPVRLELQLDQGVTAKPPSLAAGAAAWSALPQAAGLASSPSAGTHCAGCMQNGWSTTSRVH